MDIWQDWSIGSISVRVRKHERVTFPGTITQSLVSPCSVAEAQRAVDILNQYWRLHVKYRPNRPDFFQVWTVAGRSIVTVPYGHGDARAALREVALYFSPSEGHVTQLHVKGIYIFPGRMSAGVTYCGPYNRMVPVAYRNAWTEVMRHYYSGTATMAVQRVARDVAPGTCESATDYCRRMAQYLIDRFPGGANVRPIVPYMIASVLRNHFGDPMYVGAECDPMWMLVDDHFGFLPNSENAFQYGTMFPSWLMSNMLVVGELY